MLVDSHSRCVYIYLPLFPPETNVRRSGTIVLSLKRPPSHDFRHFLIQYPSTFRPYISFFSLYPSLHPVPAPSLSLHSTLPSTAMSSPQSTFAQIQQVDFAPLRQSLASSFADPQRRLCQYEIPGGGTCRDDACRDIHTRDLDPDGEFFIIYILKTISSSPSDDRLARYVAPVLPSFTSEQISGALSTVRSQQPAESTNISQQPQADPLSRRLAHALQLLLPQES